MLFSFVLVSHATGFSGISWNISRANLFFSVYARASGTQVISGMFHDIPRESVAFYIMP